MSDRATCWSVTINNPNKSDDDNIAMAKQKSGWAVYGQKEVGESGTPHYQLMITTPQVRFSAIKKAFPRSHIEIARDKKALTKYVNKEDTRIAILPTDSKYPSLQTLWDMFYDYLVLDNQENRFCRIGEDERLLIFDQFISERIEEGYIVETMAVNPQIRSSIKKFGRSIIIRSNIRRQTDRQTVENNVELGSITNGTENEGASRTEDEEDEDEVEGQSVESSESH